MGNIKKLSDFLPQDQEIIKKQISKLPKPASVFDFNGLRHDHNHLESVGASIVFMPLDTMVEYVDVVTKQSTDLDDKFVEDQLMQQSEDTFPEIAKTTNATGVGNLAYITVNSKNNAAKEKAMRLLELIYTIQYEITVKAIHRESQKYGQN
jgi:hypothetical protein